MMRAAPHFSLCLKLLVIDLSLYVIEYFLIIQKHFLIQSLFVYISENMKRNYFVSFLVRCTHGFTDIQGIFAQTVTEIFMKLLPAIVDLDNEIREALIGDLLPWRYASLSTINIMNL